MIDGESKKPRRVRLVIIGLIFIIAMMLLCILLHNVSTSAKRRANLTQIAFGLRHIRGSVAEYYENGNILPPLAFRDASDTASTSWRAMAAQFFPTSGVGDVNFHTRWDLPPNLYWSEKSIWPLCIEADGKSHGNRATIMAIESPDALFDHRSREPIPDDIILALWVEGVFGPPWMAPGDFVLDSNGSLTINGSQPYSGNFDFLVVFWNGQVLKGKGREAMLLACKFASWTYATEHDLQELKNTLQPVR